VRRVEASLPAGDVHVYDSRAIVRVADDVAAIVKPGDDRVQLVRRPDGFARRMSSAIAHGRDKDVSRAARNERSYRSNNFYAGLHHFLSKCTIFRPGSMGPSSLSIQRVLSCPPQGCEAVVVRSVHVPWS
jgi:hypothetical protein